MEKKNQDNRKKSIEKIRNGLFTLKKNKVSFVEEKKEENYNEKNEQVLVNENALTLQQQPQHTHHQHHHHHHHHHKQSKDENGTHDETAEKKNVIPSEGQRKTLQREDEEKPINRTHHHHHHEKQKKENEPQHAQIRKNSNEQNKQRASIKQPQSEEQQTDVPITTLTPREIKVTSEKLIKAKSWPHIKEHDSSNEEAEDGEDDEDENVSGSREKTQEEQERPEYASNPNEFLKDGSPMPFWMSEMKKGTEYILKLHKKYGKVEKHELRPTYKADLTKLSVATPCSYNGSDSDSDSDILDPALKVLKPYDRFFLNHKVELRHGICFCMNKSRNEFQVVNYHGHLMYWVTTQKTCCRYAYTFVDYAGKETLKVEPGRGLPKYRRSYRIYCPVDVLAGTVVQILKLVCSDPEFFVSDENDIKILEFHKIPNKVKARNFGPGFKPDIVFEFKSKRGQGPMGRITTKLADLKRANFTDFDYYGVHIQDEMTCNIKGRIMAAWFVIYLYYYDGKTHKDVHHNLTDAAKKLFEDKKPSVEEIPHNQPDGQPY